MKKNFSTISIAAILGIAIFATGCDKGPFSRKGGEITFGTVSGSQTKTVYGDDFTSSSVSYQSINWEENDYLRIVSDQAGVYSNSSNLRYADYVVSDVTNTENGGISKATVSSTPNGLCWKDEYTDSYKFYGVYPKPGTGAVKSIVAPDAEGNLAEGEVLGTVTAELPDALTLPTETSTKYIKVEQQTVGDKTVNVITPVETADEADYTYTVYAPDMDYAVMTAAATGVTENDNEPQVSLHFKPAFTAIEINLSSGDEDGFGIKELSLSAAADEGNSDYLAGTYSLVAGSSSVSVSAGKKSVTVTPTSALPITATTGFTMTLFTVPVTNSGVITLSVKTSEGTTAKLALLDTDKTSAYKFEAGKKYRINLLKLGGKFTYAIALAGEALPWQYVEESTTYSENVQAKAFSIEGALETLESYTKAQSTIDLYGKETSNHYESYDTGTNSEFKTYAEWVALGSGQAAYNAAHPTYYQLHYQLRTLSDPAKGYFEVTFTPIAPLGGYWNLSAEAAPSFGTTAQGGPEGFEIYLWDGESHLTNWNSGQIMNQTVTLHIFPAANRDTSKEYCMLLKSFFSPNKSGEPTYSADSELQDVHGDGRYSYWKFVIPATE